MSKTPPSVAIVYDNLTTAYGGAEVVLQSLHNIFPDAPIITSVHIQEKTPWTKSWKIHTSWLQKLPLWLKSRHQLLAPVMPLAFESLDLRGYEIVISVSAAAAKGVITSPEQFHLCYLLTPTRYLYLNENEVLSAHWALKLPGINYVARQILQGLRRWDRIAAQRPDAIMAISSLVSRRIAAEYKRTTQQVIYPPFAQREDILHTSSSALLASQPEILRNYSLCLSRLVWYKRFDIAIQAALLSQTKLVIAGTGEQFRPLIHLAGSKAVVRTEHQDLAEFFSSHPEAQIYFTNIVTDAEATALLKHAKCLVMPGIEDFGMVAIEAMNAGIPVVINAESGAAEIIRDGVHGIHIASANTSDLATALTNIHTNSMKFSYTLLKRHAESYSRSVFEKSLQQAVLRVWHTWKHTKESYE